MRGTLALNGRVAASESMRVDLIGRLGQGYNKDSDEFNLLIAMPEQFGPSESACRTMAGHAALDMHSSRAVLACQFFSLPPRGRRSPARRLSRWRRP